MARNLTLYNVLKDAAFVLPRIDADGLHETEELTFDPPDDIVLDDGDVRYWPVLSYRADPSNGADDVKLTVSVRDNSGATREASSFTLGGTVSRAVFEAVKPSHLHSGRSKIIFSTDASHGSGEVAVSDVIVWFTRRVSSWG
ncbi:hypothetical protein [Blastococcus mobilis]|uniref:Uncharacterized protein n=1 Tax=Blastococcus mobilis TaxID=1938746 RepID=A0A238ZAD0_9ACTN|nr:hypothetical protein [Blastococcus mobilis]SNR80495.1 hypothetical protein SAMN06272737_1272 [Blastococcus mobilis]